MLSSTIKRIVSGSSIKLIVSSCVIKRAMSGSSIKPKAVVQEMWRCAVKPERVMEGSHKTCYLTPWGLTLLAINYAQVGLLFNKPPSDMAVQTIVNQLKASLSCTLTQFYPLAGRLKTEVSSNSQPSYCISVDCTNPKGAEFIFAQARDVTAAQVTSPNNYLHNPDLVNSLFAFRTEIGHDGHTIPLLAVQVTELLDGIFIACSGNHAVVDGTSFWHFMQTWSDISSRLIKTRNRYVISHPPLINESWVLDNYGPAIDLPFEYYSDIPQKAPPPPLLLRDRIFHFSAQSMERLKAQANAECSKTDDDNIISSFQAFNAFLWRCVTRARDMPMDQKTSCLIVVNDRSRLHPTLSPQHFGCYVQALVGTATAGELLANNLGWSAWLLHKVVVGHTSKKLHKYLEDWVKSPFVPQYFRDHCMLVENSPRFKVYSYDFGWGRPLAVRSGFGNKNDGAVFLYQGRGGGGSIEVELFLSPESMDALLSDAEFLEVVSSP